MGSVKDLEIIEEPSEEKKGIGRFHFSDRYSVFDWGEMPDHIDKKGESLCLMGAYFFEKLERKGINTHYRGLVNEEGDICNLSELREPSSIMEVDLVRVIEPTYEENGYDYSVFDELRKRKEGNFLIPLEVIYRNGLPDGSSVFRRLKEGKMSLKDFGLEKKPEPGQKLKDPIYDVSTKLEEKDRYIKWPKAQKIASLSDAEINEIKNVLEVVNQLITKEVNEANLSNEDGKIELGFDENRDIMLVDVVGTLDECRFMYDGVQVSKEIARQYYKGSEWHKEVREAKKEAKEKGIKNWKKLCSIQPKEMDKEMKEIISHIYTSAANEVIGKDFFDSPRLKEVLKRYKSIRR